MPVLAQIKKNTTEELYYFYNDDLGSRRTILDDSGNVIEKLKYTAFGELTRGSIENASFTGKQLDATGLYYFNARYYDPEVKRFITEDPAKQGSGWYTYCNNNPINHTDPDGMQDPVSDDFWNIPMDPNEFISESSNLRLNLNLKIPDTDFFNFDFGKDFNAQAMDVYNSWLGGPIEATLLNTFGVAEAGLDMVTIWFGAVKPVLDVTKTGFSLVKNDIMVAADSVLKPIRNIYFKAKGYNVLNIGPGINSKILTELQQICNETGEIIVTIGGRQTGISRNTLLRWNIATSDLDLLTIGGKSSFENLLYNGDFSKLVGLGTHQDIGPDLLGWTNRLTGQDLTIITALEQGLGIVMPK